MVSNVFWFISIDPYHKYHNTTDKYPAIHHFVTKMCTHYNGHDHLLSHLGIPGVTLCFCTSSYTAGRRVLFRQLILKDSLDFFHFWHDHWPWPIDYLIRFWSIFIVTFTLIFLGQIWNLPQMWPMVFTFAMTLIFEFSRSNVTLTFDHTHGLDQRFSWSDFEITGRLTLN